MVRFPFTFNHVPNLVLFFVLARVVFLLEMDSIVVLGDVVDNCFIAHALEDSAAAYGTPAILLVRFEFRSLAKVNLRIFWLLDLNALERLL